MNPSFFTKISKNIETNIKHVYYQILNFNNKNQSYLSTNLSSLISERKNVTLSYSFGSQQSIPSSYRPRPTDNRVPRDRDRDPWIARSVESRDYVSRSSSEWKPQESGICSTETQYVSTLNRVDSVACNILSSATFVLFKLQKIDHKTLQIFPSAKPFACI